MLCAGVGAGEIESCLNFTRRAVYQTWILQRFSSGGLENRFEARVMEEEFVTVIQVRNAEMQMIRKKRK